MAKEMQKNGGSSNTSGLGLLGGLNGLGGGMGSSTNNLTSPATSPNNMPSNPFFPMGMAGSGFGGFGGNINQGLNSSNNQNFPSLFSNPFSFYNNLNPSNLQQNGTNVSSSVNQNSNLGNQNNQANNSFSALF